jgi:hypothetical protein
MLIFYIFKMVLVKCKDGIINVQQVFINISTNDNLRIRQCIPDYTMYDVMMSIDGIYQLYRSYVDLIKKYRSAANDIYNKIVSRLAIQKTDRSEAFNKYPHLVGFLVKTTPVTKEEILRDLVSINFNEFVKVSSIIVGYFAQLAHMASFVDPQWVNINPGINWENHSVRALIRSGLTRADIGYIYKYPFREYLLLATNLYVRYPWRVVYAAHMIGSPLLEHYKRHV